MSLAEADTTVNKERIVFLARALGDRQRGSVRELIARPDYEFGKSEARIQLRVQWSPGRLELRGSSPSHLQRL